MITSLFLPTEKPAKKYRLCKNKKQPSMTVFLFMKRGGRMTARNLSINLKFDFLRRSAAFRFFGALVAEKTHLKGNPRRGFSLKTVHWTVFSPFPAFYETKEFRFLRKASKGSAFGNRKPLKRFDRNFCIYTIFFSFKFFKKIILP